MNQIFIPVKKQKNTPLYLFTFTSNMSQSVHAWIHILLKYVALTSQSDMHASSTRWNLWALLNSQGFIFKENRDNCLVVGFDVMKSCEV